MTDFKPQKADTTKKSFAGRGYPIDALGGRQLPSVTNILDCVGKPFLPPWAAKKEREYMLDRAAELYFDVKHQEIPDTAAFKAVLLKLAGPELAHRKFMGTAADVGTAVHSAIEKDLRHELGLEAANGKKPSLNDEQKRAARQAYASYQDWRTKKRFKPLMIEKKLWSLEYGYAGTMDVYGSGNFQHEQIFTDFVVGDWKTSAGIYYTAHLQIAAYRHAMIEMGLHAKPVPKIVTTGDAADPDTLQVDSVLEPIPLHGLILRLPKNADDPDFEPRFLTDAEMQEYFQAFLAVKALWDSLQTHEKKFPYRRKTKTKTKVEAA